MPAGAAEAEATTTAALAMGVTAVGMATAEARPGAETGAPSVAGTASPPTVAGDASVPEVATETEIGVMEAGTATTSPGTVAVGMTVVARMRVGARGGPQMGASGPSARSVPDRAPGMRCRLPRGTRLRLRALVPTRSRP